MSINQRDSCAQQVGEERCGVGTPEIHREERAMLLLEMMLVLTVGFATWLLAVFEPVEGTELV